VPSPRHLGINTRLIQNPFLDGRQVILEGVTVDGRIYILHAGLYAKASRDIGRELGIWTGFWNWRPLCLAYNCCTLLVLEGHWDGQAGLATDL
jgi:hypothetical protein